MRLVHRIEVPGGTVALDMEVSGSVDPRGGLFGYADAVDQLPRPLRDAIIEGAIDGERAGRDRGVLGVIDEVFLHEAIVQAAPDLVALRDAVRTVVAAGRGPGSGPRGG